MKSAIRIAAIAGLTLVAACSDKSAEDKKGEAAGQETTGPAQPVDAAAELQKEVETMTEVYKSANLAYLDDNKAKDGVVVADSGLQYTALASGDGASPTRQDFVTVHYTGKFIDGRVFDSSVERGEPATFPAGGLIPGFTEALTMMKEGDKWEVTIPSDLAYGENGAGGGIIPGHSTLIFEIELLEVMTEEEAKIREAEMRKQAEAEAAAFRDNQLEFLTKNLANDGVKATESGLQYRVITEGTGAQPSATSQVTVHYKGTLINGQEFDSSYKRGQPASFPLNGVIRGWTEGLQLMKEGGKYEFFIPFDLGYGERGSPGGIPPYATLIFEVELISVDS